MKVVENKTVAAETSKRLVAEVEVIELGEDVLLANAL